MKPAPLRSFPKVVASLCTLLSACATTSQSQDEKEAAPPAASITAIEGKEIDEASGMATSAKHPGITWIINDGPGGNLLFAVDADGAIRGRVPIDGIRTRDAEDLAAFPWRGAPHLLVADVGDNKSDVGTYTLHAVPEPELGAKSVRPTWSLRFRYEDGAHNCESVAVDHTRSEVLIVTKRNPASLFVLPLRPHKEIATAERLGPVATLPPKGLGIAANLRRIATRGAATALDLSPDSRSAAVLTYSHINLYRRAEAESWEDAFARAPTVLPMPELLQAEALTFTRDGREIRVASERIPAQLARVPLFAP